MKEEYLHLIWSQKRLPFHQMKLMDGRDFLVKSVGELNKESGPDFFNGEIIIDDIKWIGNIEIHVKSSDWYLHNHQIDLAYNNVILHVVYEYDKDVFIEGRKVPTLELKQHLQFSHFNSFQQKCEKPNNDFICKDFFHSIDSVYFENMKEKALIKRLDRKIAFLKEYQNFDIGQILYLMLSQAFGMKVNASPFQQLTYLMPLKLMQKECRENVRVLLIGLSGLSANILTKSELDKWEFYKHKYEIQSLPTFLWKKKGLRPEGFPEKRLEQFCEVVKNCDFNSHFLSFKFQEIHSYLIELMNGKISKEVSNCIIINAFVPFIYWYGKRQNNYEIIQKALDLLLLIDAEKNSILKKWKTFGIKIKKAYDSQALLEIYNEFCIKKMCLSCSVGNKLLNS